MPKFSESFLSEVAERNSIEDVVSQYISLSKRSGANLFGLCPFHNEKTPSFSVSPAKQIYHCFGCGKGGGVINFIMEMENLSFPESVEFLAKRVGMAIPEAEEDAESKKRERIYALNKDAARFFYEQLSTPAGKKACAYMAQRKITPASARNFGLGCAPDSWDSLRKAMHAKGYSDAELLSADLIRPGKSGNYYDTFRDRLVFPVIDIRGNVIGFSGRMLGDREPKYLNSKETAVFTKSRNLFGMNIAKKSKSGYILLVEGNIDVVSLHQAGFDSAVASLGTSFTEEQARLISRFTHEVILAYDSDGAGVKASRRAIDILEKLDVKVRVLSIPGSKDPDEYIKANGAGAFRNLIEKSESQMEYILANILSKYDLSVSDQKISYVREAANAVAAVSDGVARQVYAGRISQIASIDSKIIEDEISRRRSAMIKRARAGEARSAANPAVSMKEGGVKIRFSNPASAKAEEGVIRLIFLDPSLADPVPISPEEFSSPELANIYTIILELIQNHSKPEISVLSGSLSSDEMSLLVSIQNSPEILSSGRSTLNDYVKRIRDLANSAASGSDLIEIANALKNKGKGYKQ